MYISEGIVYLNSIDHLSVSYGSVYYRNFLLSREEKKLLQNLLNGALVQAEFGNKAATFRRFAIGHHTI